MLFSIGFGQSDPLHYAKRQSIFAVVALAGGLIASRIPMRFWQQLLPYMAAGTTILLILARAIGPRINGAHRWLILGPISFQPSEFAKLTALVWVAWWMSLHRRRATEFLRGFIVPIVGVGWFCLMVLIGPDYGTTVLIGGSCVALMFIGGTRLIYLLGSVFLGFSGMTLLVLQDPERLSRVTSFLYPEKYASDESFQLMNSLFAFINGGSTGLGVGGSLQKFSYLPEAHTDFILAIIAEELGLIGSLGVVLFFFLFFLAGMWISWRNKDPFSRLLGFGITLLISLQACINIGVVTGSMPTKGLPLPFISHGGSNLVFMVAMAGILVKIAKGDSDARKETRQMDSSQWM